MAPDALLCSRSMFPTLYIDASEVTGSQTRGSTPNCPSMIGSVTLLGWREMDYAWKLSFGGRRIEEQNCLSRKDNIFMETAPSC